VRIFLDANVLITVLCNEYPRFTACARVLSLCDHPRFTVYTSPLCIGIAAYFTEKKNGQQMAKKKIGLLLEKLHITTINEEMTKLVMSNPKVVDVEDGLQYYSALDSECTCMVTYDKGDFHFAEVEVLDAEEFLRTHVLEQIRR
jgi:predicted nucleic acid-binding protein